MCGRDSTTAVASLLNNDTAAEYIVQSHPHLVFQLSHIAERNQNNDIGRYVVGTHSTPLPRYV